MIRRNEIKFVVFLVLLPFILIALAEGAGRAYMSVKYGVPGKSYGIYQADSELGGILSPNSYNTLREFNNLAFQRADETRVVRPEGQLRAVAYGGSTTFSYNVTMAQAWPAVLERNLRAAGHKNAEILNAGDVVWSLGHAIVRARRELPALKPDYVIIYSGINEWSNDDRLKLSGIDLAAELEKGRHGIVDNNLMKANFLFRNSLIYKFLHHKVLIPLGKMGANRDEAPRHQFDPAIQRNYDLVLRDFISLAKEVGARVVFVIQAEGIETKSAEDAATLRQKSPFLRTAYAAAEIAREMGAIVLDAQDAVRDAGPPAARLFGPGSTVHYSVEGSKVLADFLARKGPWRQVPAATR